MKKKLVFLAGLVLALCLTLSVVGCVNEKKQLGKPADLTVIGTTLNWAAVDNATGYIVNYGENQESTVTTNSFSFATFAAGSYTFKVMATGDTSKYTNSEWSAPLSHTILPGLAAPSPSVSNNALAWAAVSNAVEYEIEITKGGTVVTPNITQTALTYNLLPLGAGVYTFKVRAIATATTHLNSEWSAATAAYTVDAKLAAPANVAATGMGVVSWNASLRATSYTVRAMQGDEVIETATTAQLTHTFADLDNGEYKFSVKATATAAGFTDSDFSADTTLTLFSRLAAPAGLAYNGQTKLLTWTAVTGAQSYIVDVEGALFPVDDESFDVSELAHGDYDIRVKAVANNTDARDSEFSANCSLTHSTTLATPELNLASGKLSWGAIAGATAYELDIDGVAILLELELEDGYIEDKDHPEIIIANFKDENNMPYFYAAGTYTVKVKALGDGAYIVDSELSNAVTHQIAHTENLDYTAIYGVDDPATTEINESETIIAYEVSAGSAADEGTELTIKIPSYHEGKPVIAVKAADYDDVAEVYSGSFMNKTNIAQVIFGHNNTLTSIGDYAFSGCINLLRVSVPSNVVSIGDYAFSGCYNAETIWIGDKSQEIKTGIAELVFEGTDADADLTIGEGAFKGSCLIESIVFPENLVLIGEGAFSGTTFERMRIASITFAENGRLETIGANAFANGGYLTTVTIPASVTLVEDSAFANGFTAETTYVLVDGTLTPVVEEFGLTEVIFLGGADDDDFTLGASVFSGCEFLTTVSLPANTIVIGANAFANTAVEGYHLNPGGSTYSTDEFGLLFNADKTELIAVPASVTLTAYVIPASVVTIASSAFYGNKTIKTITFENGSEIDLIGTDAFRTSAIQSITFPSVLTQIDATAFQDCGSLTEITFNTESEITEAYLQIGASAFRNCSALQTLTLPESLLSMGEAAFQNCAELTTVVIPASLETLPTAAFRACGKLNNITFNEGLKTIGEYAFYQAGNVAGTVANTVEFPSTLEEIKTYAFYQASFLTGFSFNDDVTVLEKIGNNAFDGCSKLGSLTIPQTVEAIGNNAFYGCSSLTEVEVPDSVTLFGTAVFQGCTNLQTAVLSLTQNTYTRTEGGSTITEILTITILPNNTFRACTNLTSVTLPDTIEAIGTNAFYGCSNLASDSFFVQDSTAGLPSALKTIGDSAFYNCTSLTTIALPDSVIEIKANAFNGSGLVSINISESVSTIDTTAFANTASLATITVDGGNSSFSVDTTGVLYKGTTLVLLPSALKVSGDFITTYAVKSGTVAIADYAFYNYAALTSISMPNSVKTIGNYAFNGTKITSIDLSAVESIGTHAFIGTLLTSVDFSSMKTIGNYAFQAVGLTSVNITKTVTAIGTNAFDWTSTTTASPLTAVTFEGDRPANANLTIGNYAFRNASITELILPEKVTTIGSNAFSGCKSLIKVVIPSTVTTISSAAFSNCGTGTGTNYTGGIQEFYIKKTTVLTYGGWLATSMNLTNGHIYFNNSTVLGLYSANSTWSSFTIFFAVDPAQQA